MYVCLYRVQAVSEEDGKMEEGWEEGSGSVGLLLKRVMFKKRRGGGPFDGLPLCLSDFRRRWTERGIHEWTGWMDA